MVSTRRSSNVVEDSNALTLRSRTIDVESRHRTRSDGSYDNAETETPRKRRKIRPDLNEDAIDTKTTSAAGDALPTVIRLKADADEGPASPTAATANPESGTTGGDMENTGPSDQLDATSTQSADNTHSGLLDRLHGLHKRFLSGEPQENIEEDGNPLAVAMEDEMTNAQAERSDSAADASDDDDGPETFATNLKQTFPHVSLTAKTPKPKKRKLAKPAQENIDRETSPPMPATQTQLSGPSSGDAKSTPSPPPEAVAAPPRPTRTAPSAPKKVKDVRKDGVIYRTISSDHGTQGGTSAWLPAKVSQESRRIKENLLVRKRVQNVYHRRPVKFVR